MLWEGVVGKDTRLTVLRKDGFMSSATLTARHEVSVCFDAMVDFWFPDDSGGHVVKVGQGLRTCDFRINLTKYRMDVVAWVIVGVCLCVFGVGAAAVGSDVIAACKHNTQGEEE